MSAKHHRGTTLGEHPKLYPYVLEHIGENAIQAKLHEDIAKEERPQMMGAPDEAQFLAWLCALIGAKRVVEVGVFRGSTTLAIAQAIPADGKVIGLDINADYAGLGQVAWKEAGVADKVDFRVGKAAELMEGLLQNEGMEGTVDLVFIDADKVSYDTYYELSLRLLKKGGIVAVDNVLWGGTVLDAPEAMDDDTKTIVGLNKKIRSDSRVSAVMLPIADGCYLARKL